MQWYGTRRNFKIQRHVLLERMEVGGSGKLLPMEALATITESVGVPGTITKSIFNSLNTNKASCSQQGVTLDAIKHRTIAYYEKSTTVLDVLKFSTTSSHKRLCPLSPSLNRAAKYPTQNSKNQHVNQIQDSVQRLRDERTWPEWKQQQRVQWHLPEKVVWGEWTHSKSRMLASLIRRRAPKRSHAYEYWQK
jgi:hypothetical protein